MQLGPVCSTTAEENKLRLMSVLQITKWIGTEYIPTQFSWLSVHDRVRHESNDATVNYDEDDQSFL